MQWQVLFRAAALGVSIGAAACSGSVAGNGQGQGDDGSEGGSGGEIKPGGDGVPAASDGLGRLDESQVKECSQSKVLDPGSTVIRRLTRREYDNTIADLLFDASSPSKQFPSDERRLSFDNNAAYLNVSPTHTERYDLAAETLATAAVQKNLAKLVSCKPASATDEVCAKTFINGFVQRAFRRPVEKAEEDRFLGVFRQGAKTDFNTGVSLVVQAVLQSAPFLYRVEFGEPVQGDDKFVKLTSWEIASRLSYLLWASMPDEALFAAAKDNKLQTRAQVSEHVQRMLKDPKAKRMVGNFHEQWLGLGDVQSIDRDAKLFPDWKNENIQMLKQEVNEFTSSLVFNDGNIKELFTAPHTMMNGAVAKHYGVSSPTGTTFEKVEDDKRHAGVFTLGAVMASTGKINQSSPVLRGKFVREHMLCQSLPPPPPDVNAEAPSLDPKLTTRDRFAQHSENPACANCHRLLDPVGLGMENFDAVGRYRDKENGLDLNVNGKLEDTDVDGTFNGVFELAQKLSTSEEAQRCMVTNWFRFAYGRTESDSDLCFLHQLDARLVKSSGNLRELLVATTELDAFFYRRAGGAQ
ncbi:MAG: DUF1592 domain-containing protein [Deltaproteobacteria bacterium]|nr:DUF1592 domain-containing protein [Deltaproteobacteria bacterium]